MMKLESTNPNLVRLLIIGAAFLTVTLVLILLQPSNPTAELEDTQIATAAEADADTVTRATTDLMSVPRIATAQPASVPTDALTANVLASLAGAKPQPAAPAVIKASDDPLRNLTSGVLANLSGNIAPTPDAPQSMAAIISQALQQGQSDAYIDALLNEAANSGAITVPVALRTDTGRVDTSTLLADLVAKSTPTSGAALAALAPGGVGVEVRVVQRGSESVKYHFYTVQSGDSLGAIAHRFYGDAALYSAIFSANRQILSSPDRVRAGQRLSIPDIASG